MVTGPADVSIVAISGSLLSGRAAFGRPDQITVQRYTSPWFLHFR